MALPSLAPRTPDASIESVASVRPSAKVFALARAKPKILFATPELADFAATSDLAVVSASLPRALRPTCDVRVVLPGYQSVLAKAPAMTVLGELPAHAGLPSCTLGQCALADGLEVYVVLCDELFSRDGGPYADANGEPFADNDVRFARFSLAVAEIAARGAGGWTPDVVHLNDWPTALTAGYLAWAGVETPTLLTIHDLGQQGQFAADRLESLAIPAAAFDIDGVEFYGRISFLKAGLAYARRVTTVSETYAREIVGPEHGCGLEGLLARRAGEGRLTGVPNGVEDEWDPRVDRNCPYLFDPQRWKGRYADFLRGAFGLSLARAPLFAFVGGFTHANGIDLVMETARRIYELGAQFVAVGEGDKDAERALVALSRQHGEAIGVRVGFDPDVARMIFAGADFLLTPSRAEPCGLSPMYAQKFGALPIAHAAETVSDGKTGFLIEDATAAALENAVIRALAIYQNAREFSTMRRAAMALDFSWRRSAQRYAELYRDLRPGSAASGG